MKVLSEIKRIIKRMSPLDWVMFVAIGVLLGYAEATGSDLLVGIALLSALLAAGVVWFMYKH
jgi:uncharacterized membrane protein YcaP (DUF421 family)